MRLFAIPVVFALASLTAGAAASAPGNPLMQPSTLPFGAFPFDRISDSDYQPAIEAGMAQQRKEMDAIANDPAPPTFANTFVAMEKSGLLLTRAMGAFSVEVATNSDPQLLHVRQIVAPELAANHDAIYLNPKLFARVRTIYTSLDRLNLDPESRHLVITYYPDFVHAGAELTPAKQAQLKELNQQLATLQTAFERKLLAGTAAAALVVKNKSQLAGLSDSAIAAAEQAAIAKNDPGGFLIALQNTTQQPSLTLLQDRATRQQLFENSWTRTEKTDDNDTRSTITQMAKLRAEKAQVLGYSDFAAYQLTQEMAQTPAAVQTFLQGLIGPTRAKAAKEAAEIQVQIDASGQHFQLQPYDWNYYAEQVRKAKYSVDDNEIRPYFELNDVLQNGLFYAANQLYGITFKERHDIPVWQRDVRVFEVFDKNGAPLALMYFDFFKRDNKQGGAWMSSFTDYSSLLGTKPVVYNVENIPKGPPGQPTLLTIDSVKGMFHEFGHALNGFFADEKYPSLSGTARPRDFVEFPSQFNEHWALYPSVLKHYAFNYQTHEPMPHELIGKMERAAQFNTGYSVGESLAADELDMAWHSLPASAPLQDVDGFETHALHASGTDFPNVPPRYRSTYFAHIWGSGYAAGYYAYMWSEMLDDDAYQWFLDHGGLTRANGQRFRDMILSRGDSEDYGPMFRAFYGKDPEVGPLLKDLGLTTDGT
ncbi:MAG TPA: M3 family metallopeptidase [Candidatus Baltobacteraceae bacterium]|nr:M3 family metallopeptidase [Candidatus Baltobacteraceae bacterium]